MNFKLALLFVAAVAYAGIAQADFESAATSYRDKNYKAAFDEFMQLATAGDARAQTIIGMMYKFGESVEPDATIAFSWYLKAAESGYAPAQFSLGEMYATGLGVEEDSEAAVTWLNRAAEAGYERANQTLHELDTTPIASQARVDESIPWSQTWDLRLPNQIRFNEETPPPAIDASYRIQLGAMNTQAAAYRLWQLVTSANADMFRGYEPVIVRATEDGRRFYRVQTGPFDSFREARDFCEVLIKKDRRAGCITAKL